MLNVFRDEHDVADANAELVDDQEAIGDENGRWCDPSDYPWSLLECELHALRIWQQRPAVLLAEDVLRLHKDVKAVGADETDDGHEDESVEPSAVVERLVHR